MLLYQLQGIVSDMWEAAVQYAFIQDVPANEEIYEKIRAKLGDTPDGLIVHLAFKRPEGLRYLDVWESESHWRRFQDEVVEPAVGEVLAGYGIPHDHTMVTVEEIEVIDTWLGVPSPA
jgi:hypothetical protein